MARRGAVLLRAYRGELPLSSLQSVVELLRGDGLCIIPTGAHYSMVCGVNRPKAWDRLSSLAGVRESVRRGKQLDGQECEVSPAVLLCASLQQVAQYVHMTDAAFRFVRSESPGSSVFVLPTRSDFPRSAGKMRFAAVRIPGNGVPQAVLRELDVPVMSVAVPHGVDEWEYGLDASLIQERWGHSVDAIVDEGVLERGEEAWYDCTGDGVPVSI